MTHLLLLIYLPFFDTSQVLLPDLDDLEIDTVEFLKNADPIIRYYHHHHKKLDSRDNHSKILSLVLDRRVLEDTKSIYGPLYHRC
jgi:hypothetical protein